MGQRIRTADDESLEGQARIERRAAERLVHAHERHAGAGFDSIHVAQLARQRRRLRRRFGLGHRRADRRRANAQLQAADGRILGLPFGEHVLAVMRLDPGPQKARRHRQPHRAIVRGVELHAAEPAGEDVLAELFAELLLDPLPALPVSARHFGLLISSSEVRVHRATQARQAPPCPTLANATHMTKGVVLERCGSISHSRRWMERRFSRWAWWCRAETSVQKANTLWAKTRPPLFSMAELSSSCPHLHRSRFDGY